jgi:hypothetical protein
LTNALASATDERNQFERELADVRLENSAAQNKIEKVRAFSLFVFVFWIKVFCFYHQS